MPEGFAFPIGSLATSRRRFLTWTTSLAAAALWSSRATGAVLQSSTFSDYPFTLGVASGDPSPDGFVLWTRLAPKPFEGGGMPDDPVDVSWQVAKDEKMSQVVAKGSTVATPEWAHSVHVEVSGLEPDRWYFYQFKAGSETSPVGRTRTFPAAGSTPKSLKFAFASCQHYESGYYTAYEYMAKDDLDLVAHLGDYIYEGAASKKGVRQHNSKKIQTLDEYRNRYALYKGDLNLQATHQKFPWIVTWDDHEVENNYANDISEYPKVDPATFLKQRASAYKAYYEHMPLRKAALPTAHDMLLYRKLSFGPLADFLVLDTRQYRTDQPCEDGTKVPCEAVFDPKGTILGATQKKWMFDELLRSKANWNVLAQQVMMARVGMKRKDDPEAKYSMDKWTGYEADRRQVLKFLGEGKVTNPIVITGDIHSHWANNLDVDFDGSSPRTVAAEFVGTSISSSGDGTASPEHLGEMLSQNPCVKYHAQQRGYVKCDVTPERWKTDYQVLEFVSKPGSPIKTQASFVVESGKTGLQKS
ncbi:alkaline phosphatase D family protein [bacterium]|nr:alkaline phosphatase D family protein [bacterium]